MKNLAKSAGLLFVALGALCLTSCTKNEDLKADLKPKATAFANASIILQTDEAAPSPTGKTDVKRGTLFAWIDDVNITTTSLDWNFGPFTTEFNLVPNDNNGNGLPNYVIPNVALGNTKFEVVTTTSTVGENTFVPGAKATAQADWDLAKAKNPYAIYGITFNALVHDNGQLTPDYAQTLKTDHGRGIAVFTLGEDLLSLGGSAIVVQGGRTVAVNSTTNGNFYLSDANTVGGNVITFTVQIKTATGVNFGDPITTTLNIAKSTSVNNKYIINKGSIKIDKTMEQFVAEPFKDQDGTVIIN